MQDSLQSPHILPITDRPPEYVHEAVRDWIDGRQLTEMKRICEREFLGRGELFDYVHCETAAQLVWFGLRHVGRDAFYHG